jgi:cytochrome c5
LPEGDAKAIVVRMCTKCHGATVFANVGMNRVSWQNEVAAMLEKGAVGTEDELRKVIDYLAKNFPWR